MLYKRSGTLLETIQFTVRCSSLQCAGELNLKLLWIIDIDVLDPSAAPVWVLLFSYLLILYLTFGLPELGCR